MRDLADAIELGSGHSPLLAHTRQLAEILDRLEAPDAHTDGPRRQATPASRNHYEVAHLSFSSGAGD